MERLHRLEAFPTALRLAVAGWSYPRRGLSRQLLG